MTHVFDITEYGAVGDGQTDCTAAIQTALDRAGEVCGTVVVPPGRYRTGELHMRAHTRLEGSPAWSFRSDGLSTLLLCDPGARCLLDITGAFGCAVSGLCLDGQRLGSDIHGIYLYWERYNGGSEEDTPCIDDCRVGNFSGDGVHLEHIWCFSIRHSMLHRNGGSGLYIDGWDAFILDNWFTANGRGGILGGPCAASITATGNRVEWNRLAGFAFPRGDSLNVTGNFFDRTFGPALHLGGPDASYRDCAVTGNIFRRGGCPDGMDFPSAFHSAHILLEGALNTTITGNTFRTGVNDDGGGTRSPEYGIVVLRSDALTVQNNVLRNGATKDAFAWDGAGDCIITDNPT